jgi:hypothetical protein
MRVSSGAVDWAPQTHAIQPRWRMLWDALWSACSTNPQTRHEKTAWEGRFARAM